LVNATVIIPIDHAMRYGLLPACIVEELAQAMGSIVLLPNSTANNYLPPYQTTI
jgi:hypothetical protein